MPRNTNIILFICTEGWNKKPLCFHESAVFDVLEPTDHLFPHYKSPCMTFEEGTLYQHPKKTEKTRGIESNEIQQNTLEDFNINTECPKNETTIIGTKLR